MGGEEKMIKQNTTHPKKPPKQNKRAHNTKPEVCPIDRSKRLPDHQESKPFEASHQSTPTNHKEVGTTSEKTILAKALDSTLDELIVQAATCKDTCSGS